MAERCVACGKEIDVIGLLVDGKARHFWCYEDPPAPRMHQPKEAPRVSTNAADGPVAPQLDVNAGETE